jgi:hypothetical protein
MTKKPEENDAKLTQQQLAAMPLLAAGSKKKDAAAAAGVCPQTVSEWFREPYFVAALRKSREELSGQAAARLSAAADDAVDMLLTLMKSGTEATRFKAATFLLDQVLATKEGNPALTNFSGPEDLQTLFVALGVNV